MEVDQGRGKKRPCNVAELPDRTSAGQNSSGAILVDSAGTAVVAQGAVEATQQQQKEQQAEDKARAGAEPEPVAAASDPAVVGESKLEESESSSSSQSAPAAVATGVQSAIDEGDKEESRSSFAALVKTVCSHQRSYPY